jgi:hypothetical protein
MSAAPAMRQQLRIMWIAFLAAVAVYTPLPWLIIDAGADSAVPVNEALRSGLHSGALGAAVASFLSRRWFTSGLATALKAGDAAPGELWTRLRLGCLSTWMVSEAVALIGLMLGLMARQPADVLPLAAGAAALLFLHRPAVWPIDAVERAEGTPA